MADLTTNLSLVKPVVTETYNIVTVHNANCDAIDAAWASVAALTPDSATPDVSGAREFDTANTVLTQITSFVNLVAGQELRIVFNDANTRVVNGALIVTQNGMDFPGPGAANRSAVNDSITFVGRSRGGVVVAVETGRHLNVS